ncbi:hypothetical protein NQ318_020843, partial [Aromia moschata]
LLGPLFADGMTAPRISLSGNQLPLSRVVSRTMHPDENFHDHAGTVMVIAWGQFMDHDFTLQGTPLDSFNRNDPEECCHRPPHLKHPYCNEIYVPEDDYFYRLYNVRAGVLDEYIMGLMNQVAQAMDDSITQEVTNHLFKKVGARFGLDLVSFNMQRGREFGLPGT